MVSSQAAIKSVDASITSARAKRRSPVDRSIDSLEHAFFSLGVKAAVCPALANEYVALQGRLRESIKWQSTAWNLTDRTVRDRLYRALYGSRAAAEEVMLQHQDSVETLLIGSPVASVTPAAMSNGVELRSGDILVSRGGYPTSALIARGNDYPGNFSHIAFVHVDSATHEISVIEAHIERGVVIATADQYLADKKLRVMLLRLRPDLPALMQDPMLPHRAATSMLQRARTEHIPYDFTMDYADASRLFCSEVASAAYREYGITLWTGLSTISAPGLRRWLASFGVRQFETQEPSDLEYDPQLSVVAEWRSAASLFDDHVDNAVTDVMLEGAERGEALAFNWYVLPVARLMKGYSLAREALGGVGPIPEGMSPSAALRNRAYGKAHAELKAALHAEVERWVAGNGYRPPYWSLVSLARNASQASRQEPGAQASIRSWAPLANRHCRSATRRSIAFARGAFSNDLIAPASSIGDTARVHDPQRCAPFG
jgi:hypothetical protein